MSASTSQPILSLLAEFRSAESEVSVHKDVTAAEVTLQPIFDKDAQSWQEFFDRLDALNIPQDLFERQVHMPVVRDGLE